MISIPLVRRALTSDLLGRHIYLFGPGAATSEILRRLADAGAEEGTVVLSEDDEAQLGVAALFRPRLAVGAVPLFSSIATLALAEAIGSDELCATPIWPDQVAIEGRTVGRSLVETEPAGDRTGYVVLGARIDTRALEATLPEPPDWNGVAAAFLNALDKWATTYAARGPAAVRGAIRFLPRGPMTSRDPLATTC
jgi:BirA family transcriptional regulator, biotin operon repressor / biotin---[acetyl-CoA-carboxylase] ligase